jgi:hypothetical protein
MNERLAVGDNDELGSSQAGTGNLLQVVSSPGHDGLLSEKYVVAHLLLTHLPFGRCRSSCQEKRWAGNICPFLRRRDACPSRNIIPVRGEDANSVPDSER